jgi:hypothetical protein
MTVEGQEDIEERHEAMSRPGWGRLDVAVEVFNLLNEAAARNAVTVAGPAYGRIFEIVPPRMFRLSADWTF